MDIPLFNTDKRAVLRNLLDQQDVDSKEHEIVAALGGVKAILNYYISSNDFNEDQIERIIRLLETKDQIGSASADMIHKEIQEPAVSHEILLYLNRSILQGMCPGRYSNKISSLLRNRISSGLFMVALLSLFIMHFVGTSAILFILTYALVTPFALALILYINITACKMLLKSFTFWFKTIHYIRYFVCMCTLDHINGYSLQSSSRQEWYAYVALNALFNLSVLVIISSMDGLYLNVRNKRNMLILIAIYFSIGTLIYSFQTDSGYQTTTIRFADYELDLLEWRNSSLQAFVIFFDKQAIALLMDQNHATVIGNPTKIIWKQ